MSYLNETMNKELKSNLRKELSSIPQGFKLLSEDLKMPESSLRSVLDISNRREISPEDYSLIEIFLLKNNKDIDKLITLPNKYGDRLKYFVYRHGMSMTKFAEKIDISPSTLFSIVFRNSEIGDKYRDKMTIILTNEEFNMLSSYNDININIPKDKSIIDSINVGWNIYSTKGKLDNLSKLSKITSLDYDKLISGNFTLTDTRLKKISKYLKISKYDLLKDNLNLNDPLNKFGYWLAVKIYEMKNSIKEFSDRCKLDAQYIADIISNTCLIEDKDIKSIAMHLYVDQDGLIKYIPKDNLELSSIDKIKNLYTKYSTTSNNEKGGISNMNKNFNKIVRDKIKESGFTFNEFCQYIGCNKNTLTTAIREGRLPNKYKDQIVELLDLHLIENDVNEEAIIKDYIKIPDSNPINTSLSSEELKDIAALYDNTIPKYTEGTVFEEEPEETYEEMCANDNDPVPGPYNSSIEFDDVDVESVLLSISKLEDIDQIIMTKMIAKLANKSLPDDYDEETIMGKISRLSLIKEIIKTLKTE